jgi:DNA polymerase III delta prime subunit
MAAPDALGDILDRIANGEETEGDMQTLRQLLRAGNGQNVQLGKNIANIVDAQGDIQIGDRIYQGTDAEAIKAALRSVLQEARKANRSRNEKVLLTAVKQEVTARLKQSLHNAVLINLGKEQQPEQVKCPWDAEIKIGSKPSEPILDTSILEVFDREEIAGRLLILGAPGSGKTTTLLDLAKALVKRAEQQPDYPILVLFNLSSWKNDKQSMRDWLLAEFKSKYGVRADLGKQWLDERKLLPMLDGLDELEPKRQEPCVQAINQLLTQENPPLYLVACSRHQEYKKLRTKLSLNGAICLQPLTDRQIQSYLKQVGFPALAANLLADSKLLSLLNSPFLLSITVLAYHGISIEEWQLLGSPEERRQYLFNIYIQQTLTRQTKQQYYPKGSEPKPKQTLHWLTWLARKLKEGSQTEFFIEKIQPNWLDYSAQRRQYQLFLLIIGMLLVVGPAYGLVLISLGMNFIAMIILFIGLTVGISLDWYREIKPIETLRLNRKNSRKRLSIGLRNGLLFGAIGWLIGILTSGKEGGIAGGLIGGLSAGLIGWLDSGLIGPDIDMKVFPNQGMQRSASNAIVVALTFGLAFGLLGGLSGHLNIALALGIIGGLSGGLIGGGLACIQHFVLRLVLWLNGDIPWNYARFLNYANERLFLQRVGGRYRFIHDLLQEHLTSSSKTKK